MNTSVSQVQITYALSLLLLYINKLNFKMPLQNKLKLNQKCFSNVWQNAKEQELQQGEFISSN